MASPFLKIGPSLIFESERLKTFYEPKEDGTASCVKLWSSGADITPEELAKDGFYFLKKKDHCACIFCRGIVGRWEKGDTARSEHQRHYGNKWDGCRFIKGEPVGNVPMSLSEHLVPMWRETVLKRIKGNNKNPTIISPDFSLLEKREASFVSSPFSIDMRKKLSAAGFYSYHVSDHVRCFRCGLGLRNWLDSMDPLEKHAEYSPGCIVVKLLAAKNQVYKERNSSTTMIRDSGTIDMNLEKGKMKVVDDTLVDQVIKEGDIERCVVSLGFPLEAVKEAVKNRFLDTGIRFYNKTECIESVLTIMEQWLGNERIRELPKQRIKDESLIEVPAWRSEFFAITFEFDLDMGIPERGEGTAAAATSNLHHPSSITEGAVSDTGANEVSCEGVNETTTELNEQEEGSSSASDAEDWEDGAAQSTIIFTKSIRERQPHKKHILMMSPHNSTVSMRRSTSAVNCEGRPSRATPYVFFDVPK